jgi:hypothetical protein
MQIRCHSCAGASIQLAACTIMSMQSTTSNFQTAPHTLANNGGQALQDTQVTSDGQIYLLYGASFIAHSIHTSRLIKCTSLVAFMNNAQLQHAICCAL